MTDATWVKAQPHAPPKAEVSPDPEADLTRRAVARVIGALKCRYGLEPCGDIGQARNHNHLWRQERRSNLKKMVARPGAPRSPLMGQGS